MYTEYCQIVNIQCCGEEKKTLLNELISQRSFLFRLFPKSVADDTFLLWCQAGDVGTQYRSGIYYYNETQARLAQESKEAKQLELKNRNIVTEILPAKRFYRAEEYHQQYLAKGGRFGDGQSAAKGCTDPIKCYG